MSETLIDLTSYVWVIGEIKDLKDRVSSGGKAIQKITLLSENPEGRQIVVFATVFEEAVMSTITQAQSYKQRVGARGSMSFFNSSDGRRRSDLRPFEARPIENLALQTKVDVRGGVIHVAQSEGGYMVTLGSETTDGDRVYRHEADILVTDTETGMGLLKRYESQLPTIIQASGYLDQLDSEEAWFSGSASSLVIVATEVTVADLSVQTAQG